MIKAIVYKSKTGHTKQYAKMISEKSNIPCYTLKEAKTKLRKNDEIIYLGWVCATKIIGLKKAFKKYKINCCGAIGAYPKTNENIQNLKKSNNIKIPLFYMQGGIDYNKLNKLYKKLLQTIGKAIQSSDNNADKEIVEMFEKGKSFVSKENVKEIISYINHN